MKVHQTVNSETIREVRNQYYREYRARNKEKIREINHRYWERRAERAKEGAQDATSRKDQRRCTISAYTSCMSNYGTESIFFEGWV